MVDNQPSVRFTRYILLSPLQVAVYPWQYWSYVSSGVETFLGCTPTDVTHPLGWSVFNETPSHVSTTDFWKRVTTKQKKTNLAFYKCKYKVRLQNVRISRYQRCKALYMQTSNEKDQRKQKESINPDLLN